jgi:aminoglycoside 6-adenylyltransferase
MRNSEQVIQQLLKFASQDERIRAVVMNGSRVNPNAPIDIFQDYDVVFFNTNPRYYLEDQSWIRNFGELIILQQNDFFDHGQEGFIFLMLFNDGVRIDLSFDPVAYLDFITEDSLTRVLLDKDGRIPLLPPPSDSGYLPTPPPEKEFTYAINEIFWCSNNIAKGMWRDELPYVKYMHDTIVRDALLKLLDWYAAMSHGWKISAGKHGKWLEKYLPPDIWEAYVRTYAGPGVDDTWEAVFETCRLARRVGQELARELGYNYPLEDDQRMLKYLEHVRALPKNATSY